jgi:hypothetical protein
MTPHPVALTLFFTASDSSVHRGYRPHWSPPKKSRLPRRQQQPIPQVDRAALRERVRRFLRDGERQRADGLKAAMGMYQ